MLKSMTGFGRAVLEDDTLSQTWEIRSVNGKTLDVKWRMPFLARPLEPVLERIVRSKATRGRVDISLSIAVTRADLQTVQFNHILAREMLEELSSFVNSLEVEEEFVPDFNGLLKISALWEEQSLEPGDDLSHLLEEGLLEALKDWDDSRILEAKAHETDISARILHMQEWTENIASRAPCIKEERSNALRDRLTEFMARHAIELDESRFLQEVVILADKLDVSEELTRLTAHLDLLQSLLCQGVDAGRRMEFTLQECLREITTCGNKIQDSQIQHLIVDFKNELEKCREQVQNLE